MKSKEVKVPNSTFKAVIFDLNGVLIPKIWPEADTSMIELVKSLKKNNLKTAILSNLMIGDAMSVKSSDWAQYFDVFAVSGEIQSAKPEPASYLSVLDMLNCTPEQAVFVDDLPGHVAGARAVGLKAILFHNELLLRKELKSLGLL